jgi:hypothetical protein
MVRHDHQNPHSIVMSDGVNTILGMSTGNFQAQYEGSIPFTRSDESPANSRVEHDPDSEWSSLWSAQHQEPHDSHPSVWMLTIAVCTLALIAFGVFTKNAEAAPWSGTTATWYGPGFYGNGTYCGQRYSQQIRGVAIGRDRSGRYLARCGDRFAIRFKGRSVIVRVIDRCPGCVGESHRFDLSARTAIDLCACWQPFTMNVRWKATR